LDSNYGALATNTTLTQINGYISGSGLYYKRYNLTDLSPFTMTNFINIVNGTANTLPVI